jgi:hypothetical protein
MFLVQDCESLALTVLAVAASFPRFASDLNVGVFGGPLWIGVSLRKRRNKVLLIFLYVLP